MIKLIATDMDGTLLKDNKEIDKEIYELLPKMKQQGIHFVAASGRQRPSLEKTFKDYYNISRKWCLCGTQRRRNLCQCDVTRIN